MQEKKQLPGWLLACLFPAVLFYYEVVFRVSTSQNFPLEGTVYMLLFSICYAGIGYLAATLSGRKPVNYIVTLLWLILSVAPFLVEYFVYRQFKIYYDLNTCFNGAADALSDFLRELCMMIFSWDGISRIFLFLLPTGLFAIFGWRCATPRKLRLRSWLITADYLKDILFPAMDRYYHTHRSVCKRYHGAVLVFRHVYTEDRQERLKRDHDNIEVNTVADIVTLYVLIDDAPAYCSHFYCSGVGDEERTEVYVIPRSEFAKWLEVEKTMPKEGVKLYETP